MEVYIALGIYVLILGALTYIAARKKSDDDFLRASREVEWKSLALSIFSSIFSSYNIVLGITFAYLFGPWIALVYLGAFAGLVCIYYLVKSQSKKTIVEKRFDSIVDYFVHKFGNKTASILNLSLMVVLFIYISLQFFINTTVFSNILGWDKYTSSISVGIIVLLYTFIAGLKVEIFTDVFQGILMILLVGLVFMVDVSQITGETLVNFLTNTTLIIGAISLAVAQFLTLLVQPEMWQRVYAAKNIHHVRKGLIASAFLILLVVIPLIIIGLSAHADGGIENPGTLFYDILKASAPSWFMPFLAVALFAAFMSTLDSSLFAISTQLGKYGFWIKSSKKSDKETVRNIRVSIVVVTILTLCTSLYFSNFLLAVLQLISLLTVISTVILFSVIFKISKNETFVGILVALACFVYMSFGGMITEVPHTTLYPSGVVVVYMLLQNIVVRIRKLA